MNLGYITTIYVKDKLRSAKKLAMKVRVVEPNTVYSGRW